MHPDGGGNQSSLRREACVILYTKVDRCGGKEHIATQKRRIDNIQRKRTLYDLLSAGHLPILATILLSGAVLSQAALPSPVTTVETWVPAHGDVLIVDTDANIAQLVHSDGTALTFRVVTGTRGFVRYIGRTYNAATPKRVWSVRSVDTKWDRTTFGKKGTFLRLFKDPETQTPYGIHAHRYGETMLTADMRFRSMGCIIVSDAALDLIQRTYAINDGVLTVDTAAAIEAPMVDVAQW